MQKKKSRFYLVLSICIMSLLLNGFLLIRTGYGNSIVSKILEGGTNNTQNLRYVGESDLFRNISYPDDVDILFIGDSLTERADYNSLFHEYKVVNQGIGSDTSKGLYNRLDCVFRTTPDIIFIQIGVNDIVANIPNSDSITNLGYIITDLRDELPDTRIFVESLYPVTKDYQKVVSNQEICELNSQIKNLCEKMSIQYIDIYELLANDEGNLPDKYSCDGIHLMGEPYLIITKALKEAMDSTLSK